MSFGDKMLNVLLYLLSPIGNIPDANDRALHKSRGTFDSFSAKGFDRDTLKKGWSHTELSVQRDDGSLLPILLVTRTDHLSREQPSAAAGRKVPLVLWVHGGAYTMGTAKE